MSTDETALRRRADDLHAQYRYAFAGKPRITRRVTEIEALIANLGALLEEAKQMVGTGEVVDLISERYAMYTRERDEILKAKEAGPEAVIVTSLGTRANALSGFYARHFAGQSRLTRDPALLQDLVDGMNAVRDGLREQLSGPAQAMAQQQLEPVERNLKTYEQEIRTITATQAEGSGDERTTAFANVANAQFNWYRKHFAGKSRISRRIGLIERINGTLERCEREMKRLINEGNQTETNRKNLDIVQKRLGEYRREEQAIRDARSNASMFEIIDALGQDANLVFEEYANHFAGKERATRELDLLATLLDRLVEIERQMWTLAKYQENDTNARNLAIVHDTLLIYAQEYAAVREAQSH